MTSVQSHRMMSHSNTGYSLDNNLDALLDDLQSGVGPRGDVLTHTSLVNGSSIQLPPGATGYRETTTTVTQERNGVPTTSRDYQIEYLNPANSVTVMDERTVSPNPETFMLRNVDNSGKQVGAYKTASYEYKFHEKTTDAHGNPIRPETNYSVNKSEKTKETNSSAVKSNINELDVLLQELNTPSPPKRTEHSSSSRHVETRVEREYPRSSTPRSSSLTRDGHHHYGEIQNHTSPRAPHRDVTPYGDSPAPGTPRAPQRNVNVHREVNTIEHRSHLSGTRDRSGEMSPTLRRRTPSPGAGGEFRPATFNSYPHSPAETRRSRSQTRYDDSAVTSRQVTTSESKYRTNYSNHTSNARTDDPLPYRSPSPVSFPQHRSPSPVRHVVTRTDSGRALTRSDSGHALTRSDSGRGYQNSAQPVLSDPNSPTVITYKYSSHSEQHSKYPGGYEGSPGPGRRPGGYEGSPGPGPRPFPTPTPVPHAGDQSPPKKLDDLMASFQDSQRSYTNNSERYFREVDSHQQHSSSRQHNELQRSPSFERNLRPSSVKATQVYHTPSPHPAPHPAPVNEVVPAPATPTMQTKNSQTQTAKSVAGPPVYYPPGVELFAKKEEALMEQHSAGGKGKMKGKRKMEYKYEASEKSKEKSGTRVAVVPACLPLCCAMPCSIM